MTKDEAVQDFNDWWDAEYDPTGNPFKQNSYAYWAWAGWKAAEQPAHHIANGGKMIEQPAQHDIPDLIAGALGVSRGTAYDMMREALAEQPVVKDSLSTEQPAQQEPVAWAKKAMELAADLSIESLRVGSYERKDSYERTGRASWQTVEIRKKREDARERLRRHIYTSPAQRTWVGLTDKEINAAASVQSWKPFARAIEAKLKEKNI